MCDKLNGEDDRVFTIFIILTKGIKTYVGFRKMQEQN